MQTGPKSSEVTNPFELSTAPDEDSEFQALARAIKMGRGFKLIFARCEMETQRDEMIDKLEKVSLDGPAFTVRFRPEHSDSVTHLLDELKIRLAGINPPPALVIVAGLEHLVPRRAKAFASSLVSNLNASRNSFPLIVSCPLVLWTPDYLLGDIARGAPDFFSVRSGIYYFLSRRDHLDRRASELRQFSQLSMNALKLHEKRERLKELEAVIEEDSRLEGGQTSISQARLLLQKAELHLALHEVKNAGQASGRALEIALKVNEKRVRSEVYFILGKIAAEGRGWTKADELFRAALKIEEEFNDRYSQASTLHQLGRIAQEQRQWDKAEELFRAALKIYEEFNDRYSQARTLHHLGMVAQEQRQWENAEELFRAALKIEEEFNDRYTQASTLHHLGMIAQEQRQWDKAEELLRAALKIKEEFNDRYTQASTLHHLGMIAQEQRQWENAEELFRAALKIKEEFNDRYAQAGTLHHLGMIAQEQRQWDKAEELLRAALKIYEEFNDRYSQAGTLHHLGMIAQEQRQWDKAEELLRAALKIYEEFNDLYAQASTRAQLGLLFSELGRQEQAGEEFLRALDTFMSFNGAVFVRQILRDLADLSAKEGGSVIAAKVTEFLKGKPAQFAELFEQLQNASKAPTPAQT